MLAGGGGIVRTKEKRKRVLFFSVDTSTKNTIIKNDTLSKCMPFLKTTLGSGCITAVECMPRNREVVDSIPTGCWAFFSFYP